MTGDTRNRRDHLALADATDTVRLAAWFASVVFIVGYALIAIFIPDADARALVIAVIYPLPMAAASVTSWLAMRSARGKRRRLWRLTSIAAASFLAGAIYRAYSVFTIGKFGATGSFEDIAFLFGLLALVPVVLLLTDPFEVVSERRVRGIIDMLSILTVTFSIMLILLFQPQNVIGPDFSLMRNLAFASYPVVAVSFVLYLVIFKRTRWRSSDTLMLAAFIAGTAGATIAIGWLPDYNAGTRVAAVADSLLMSTFLLMALAAAHAMTQRETAASEPLPEIDIPHWPGMAALTLSLGSMPVIITYATRTESAWVRSALVVAATLLGTALVARSALITYENRKLAEKSIWDPLTGLFNHRYFKTRMYEEALAASRNSAELSICYLNVDSFNAFNYKWGHRQGDLRLQQIAQVLRKSSEIGGLAFRVGGDDFLLVLPETPIEDAIAECTRISLAVQAQHDKNAPPVTVSIGVAALPHHTSSSDALVRFATGAAYWASQRGGDRILVYDPDVVDALDSHEHVTQLEHRSQTRLVETLAAAVDARDHYTRNHSANVADLAEALAKSLGFDEEHLDRLHAAALLHDVGKIGIPDAILSKPGKLTAEEYEKIKTHPDLGARILEGTGTSEMIPWVRYHHERWDGTGYPTGLSGESIPLEARILTVCDAYDAMTSDRPYKRGRTVADAIDELHACSGTQFETRLVDAFVQTLVESWPETRLSSQADLEQTSVPSVVQDLDQEV